MSEELRIEEYYDIEVNDEKLVRISIYRGSLDIRLFVPGDNGELYPARGGIWLPIDKIGEVKYAIDGLITAIARERIKDAADSGKSDFDTQASRKRDEMTQ